MYIWCWVSREATFVRFIHDDLSDAFTYVRDGIVINGIWSITIRYVACPDQMCSYMVGVGICIWVRGSCFLFGTQYFIAKLVCDRGGTSPTYQAPFSVCEMLMCHSW